MTLIRSGFIPVPPGATPGFDHADVYHDPTMGTTRLYVAHTGADRIDGYGWRMSEVALTRLPARLRGTQDGSASRRACS